MIITKTMKEMKVLRDTGSVRNNWYEHIGVKTIYYFFGIPIYQFKDYTK